MIIYDYLMFDWRLTNGDLKWFDTHLIFRWWMADGYRGFNDSESVVEWPLVIDASSRKLLEIMYWQWHCWVCGTKDSDEDILAQSHEPSKWMGSCSEWHFFPSSLRRFGVSNNLICSLLCHVSALRLVSLIQVLTQKCQKSTRPSCSRHIGLWNPAWFVECIWKHLGNLSILSHPEQMDEHFEQYTFLFMFGMLFNALDPIPELKDPFVTCKVQSYRSTFGGEWLD